MSLRSMVLVPGEADREAPVPVSLIIRGCNSEVRAMFGPVNAGDGGSTGDGVGAEFLDPSGVGDEELGWSSREREVMVGE